MNDEYFFNCQSSFPELRESLKQYVKQPNLDWVRRFGVQNHGIPRDFFYQFEKLNQLMEDFDCRRHRIFGFYPNTCYGWHTDISDRACALNMLIDGSDCHTFFGTSPVIKENDDYENIQEVKYESDKFVLLNVQKSHTVVNLNNQRYLLTISLSPNKGDFRFFKDYLTKNNF
jgi:hypothetical protein